MIEEFIRRCCEDVLHAYGVAQNGTTVISSNDGVIKVRVRAPEAVKRRIADKLNLHRPTGTSIMINGVPLCKWLEPITISPPVAIGRSTPEPAIVSNADYDALKKKLQEERKDFNKERKMLLDKIDYYKNGGILRFNEMADVKLGQSAVGAAPKVTPRGPIVYCDNGYDDWW